MRNVVAVDLGSANTAIYQLGTGIVLYEPTVVALDSERNSVKETGADAKRLIGRASDNTEVITPVFEGEVGDGKALACMLERYLNKITLRKLSARPKVILNVPCGADVTTLRKFEKALTDCDVAEYSFVESLVLTAYGLGLNMSTTPNFIVDIGGGITEIGAVSSDGVLCGISVNMGGLTLDSMIQQFISEKFSLNVGRLTAEKIKLTVGSLLEYDNVTMVVSGSDVKSGRPRSESVTSGDIALPVRVYYDKIFEIMHMVLAKLSAEVCADIRRAGIYFSGGGSKMIGFEDYFRKKTQMRANVFENAEVAAALGGGVLAADKKLLKRYEINRK